MKQNPLYLFLLFAIIITTKNGLAIDNPKIQNDINLSGKLYLFPHTYSGSPYMTKDYALGSVFLETGERLDDVRLKYNRLTNELIFYHEKYNKLFVVDNYTLNSFVLNRGRPDSLLFIKYTGDNVGQHLKKGGFINLLYNGKLKLIVKHTASIVPSKEIDVYDKIIQKDRYYLQNGETINEINLSKRDLSKLLPNKKQEIKRIARKTHFRRKSESDMIRLIAEIDK